MTSKTAFSEESQERLLNVVREFDQAGIEYMFLNSWQELPGATPGNDVDILIHCEQYPRALDICKASGFGPGEAPYWRVEGLLDLVKKALTTHRRDAVDLLMTSNPIDVIKKIVNPTYEIHGYDSSDCSRTPLYYDDMKLDITNHLNYHTARGNKKMKVNLKVEGWFFDTRREVDGIYVPSPPCELAHLICRGVFDYEQKAEGAFPDYYINRCDELVDIVSESAEETNVFKNLLRYLFFQADELVYDLVTAREYTVIRSELERYADY